MMEQRHRIVAFEGYNEKYGTIITEKEALSVKISEVRGLAWLAAITLHRQYEFGEKDLIGATLITEYGYPTGLLLCGVIWRAKYAKRGV